MFLARDSSRNPGNVMKELKPRISRILQINTLRLIRLIRVIRGRILQLEPGLRQRRAAQKFSRPSQFHNASSLSRYTKFVSRKALAVC